MLNISFALSIDGIDCSTFLVHTYILTPAVSLLPKAFIEKRMGLQEKALQDFKEISFRNEKVSFFGRSFVEKL